MQDQIYKKIAWLLPKKLVYWVIIRAFAKATCGENGHRVPDQTGFSAVIDEWK